MLYKDEIVPRVEPSNIIPFNKGNHQKIVHIDGGFNSAIEAVLNTAVEQLNLARATLSFRIINHQSHRYFLVGDDNLQKLELTSSYSSEESIVTSNVITKNISHVPTKFKSIIIPININGSHSGNVIADIYDDEPNNSNVQFTMADAIKEIAGIIKRFQIRNKIIHHYNQQDYWIGSSLALRRLDLTIEKLARSTLPIVIHGEKGTGKIIAAKALHCHRYNEAAYFIESNCAEWTQGNAEKIFHSLINEMQEGTLFLRNIDKLSESDFAQVKIFLKQHFDKPKKNIFILLSAMPIKKVHEQNLHFFIEWIEFNSLSLHLPTLSERKIDINELVAFYLARDCKRQNFDFTPESWQLLESFNWPENICQLNSMIKKISIIAEKSLITDKMLKQWFPSLNRQLDPFLLLTSHSEPSSQTLTSLETREVTKGINATAPQSLSVINLLNTSNIENEHPALIKAIHYIFNNYQQPISMATVSSQACVSASHMSYLFKMRLKCSFKQIITEIRIDKAKYFFQKMPARQITQVCADVGFSDLSHFEKTFKRMVGFSPSSYRNQFRQPLSTNR